jgi:hypothetical protein
MSPKIKTLSYKVEISSKVSTKSLLKLLSLIMNFDVWQMDDPIKVGVGLSGTIASHKTLTLVVGMTMILDDFLRQCMLQKAISIDSFNDPILFMKIKLNILKFLYSGW